MNQRCVYRLTDEKVPVKLPVVTVKVSHMETLIFINVLLLFYHADGYFSTDMMLDTDDDFSLPLFETTLVDSLN